MFLRQKCSVQTCACGTISLLCHSIQHAQVNMKVPLKLSKPIKSPSTTYTGMSTDGTSRRKFHFAVSQSNRLLQR